MRRSVVAFAGVLCVLLLSGCTSATLEYRKSRTGAEHMDSGSAEHLSLNNG
jgi:outer membrane murein-binding lipoprotein Lpp